MSTSENGSKLAAELGTSLALSLLTGKPFHLHNVRARRSKLWIAAAQGHALAGGLELLLSCDLAVASDKAVFGVSEINWGIIPGGNVTKVLVELMSARDAMYYTLTGETFDGKKAAEMRVIQFFKDRTGA